MRQRRERPQRDGEREGIVGDSAVGEKDGPGQERERERGAGPRERLEREKERARERERTKRPAV